MPLETIDPHAVDPRCAALLRGFNSIVAVDYIPMYAKKAYYTFLSSHSPTLTLILRNDPSWSFGGVVKRSTERFLVRGASQLVQESFQAQKNHWYVQVNRALST